MLNDCLEVFKSELERKSERWLLDNYVPKDGTYILIDIDGGFSFKAGFDIKSDKKTGEIQGETNSNYRLVSFLDYYSKLVEMNKPVDSTKIIHSNNIYSFFVKKESIQSGKLTEKSLEGYYSTLSDPIKKYNRPKAREIYHQVEERIGEVDLTMTDFIYDWMKNKLKKFISDYNIDVSKKDYLKLFFVYEDKEQTRKLVRQEGLRYLYPNIYNSNEYNVTANDVTYGLPSNNMGMNAKKPYLENKTRFTKVPYLLEMEEALLQAQFFDYLSGQASKGKNNIYVDLEERCIRSYGNGDILPDFQTAIYLRIQQGKELEIHSLDMITGYNSNLKKKFYMKNILNMSDKALETFKIGYGEKAKTKEIEMLVDSVLFGGRLKFNYFTKPEDLQLNDGRLKNILLMYREKMWSWFYKGEENGLQCVFGRMIPELVKDSLSNGYIIKAAHQLNLWISIVDYLEDNKKMEETMENVRESLKKHIDSKEEWDFSSAEEYYYAVGQVVNLFLKTSKAMKKSFSMVNPVLNAKTDKIIKNRILNMFKKYNYAFDINRDYRIKNLISRIMMYHPEEMVNGYMVTAGFTDSNLVYMKKEEAAKDENN